MPASPFAERNGWKLYAHPVFGQKLESLIQAVETLQSHQAETHRSHPKAKLLKRILDLILVEIPFDPNAAEFQLGNTLGAAHRHWRRAKFLDRFRLFFRFSSLHRAIVYGVGERRNDAPEGGGFHRSLCSLHQALAGRESAG